MTMKVIQTHQYRTPMEGNDKNCYSVGVLNLTRREGEIIADFAMQLQRIRTSGQKFDRVVVPIMGPLSFTEPDLQFVPNEPALTTKPKPAPATKPAPMGGRFSGIDFGE